MPRSTREYLDLVIETDASKLLAQGGAQSRDHQAPRFWTEPFFNLLGNVWGLVMWAIPWPLRRRLVEAINYKLSTHHQPNAEELGRIKSHALKVIEELQKTTGQRPAFMVFTSHPDTTGPFEWLRFELFRQGGLVADAVVEQEHPGGWFRRHPQCFVAIDPFALDTLSPAMAGFYAGWMHRFYLAWDRQAATQNWLQRTFLLRGSGYPRIVNRLLERLKMNVPVVMVIAGGLPHNARLLYTTREFIHRMPIQRWPITKKEAALRMMDIVRNPIEGERPTEKGELPASVHTALTQLWLELGVPQSEHAKWMDEFQKEFRLEVPYRTRLFRLLTERVVHKGKPMVWIAVAHHESEPHVVMSEPWAAKMENGNLQWGTLSRDGNMQWRPLTHVDALATEFAKEFTRDPKNQ